MRTASVFTRLRHDDRGMTLIEMLVGMMLTAIFMTMFTASIVMMYQATRKSESIGTASSQLAQAFDRLDLSVRYANAITRPGTGDDGAWYVEWSSDTPDQPACSQLRLAPSAAGAGLQLQQRTWNLNPAGTATELTTWTPLASHLELEAMGQGATIDPFARHDIDADAPLPELYQRLQIHVIALVTGHGTDTRAESDVTFTALNSTGADAASTVCAQAGRS